MQNHALLSAARQALQHGDAIRADMLYRTCLERGLDAHAEYAGLFYARGELALAREILDQGLTRRPHDANLHFLRGLVRQAAACYRDAISDFDNALAVDASFVPAYVNRARALLAIERIPDAIADVKQACVLAPANADAWTQLGLLHSRDENWTQAITALETANRLAPGRPVVLRSLASAMAASGQAVNALPLLANAEILEPDNPAVSTDYALALLRCRQVDAALSRCERVLEMSPGDQTALAILYLLHLERGNREAASKLMDYGALLGHDWQLPNDGLDSVSLLDAVLTHPDLVWEPAGRSTLRGQQTARLDLTDGSGFVAFRRMIERVVTSRMHELRRNPATADHPWVRALPSRWTLQAWATVLHEGGRQRPHIHPAGCMSGVFYLDAGSPTSPDHGCLVFGHPQDDLGLVAEPIEYLFRPARGRLVTFPSYFLHHTTSFSGTRPRISLAFDVLAA